MGKLTIVFIILSFILFSCIGFESKIKINSDGSGEMQFSYHISRVLLEYGNEEGAEAAPDTPLPISEEQLADELNAIQGIRLLSASQTEDENNIIITAEIEFDDINVLKDTKTFNAWPISLEKADGKYIYQQILTEGNEDDPESAAMLESFFEGYELSITLEAPSPIIEHNFGELEESNVLVYRISIIDLFAIPEQEELVITWK